MKGLTWRITVVVATVVFAIYLLIPTYLRFAHGKQVSRVSKPTDPWYFSLLPSEVLKLGLDLMGGLHLVVGIDFDEVRRDACTKLKNQLKELCDQEKIEGLSFETTNDYRILVKFPNEDAWKRVDRLIGKHLGHSIDFVTQSGNEAILRMTQTEDADVKTRAVDQSLETLRNRIDEFGIAEPIITRQGDEKIMIQFPGVQETGRLKEIIARTAKLSFQVVRTGPEEPQGPPAEEDLKAWVKEFETAKKMHPDPGQPISKYLKELNTYLAAKLPTGTEILFHKKQNVNTRETEYIPYLLTREAIVTGEDLQDARYSYDPQTNEPIVNFTLTPPGAGKFEKGTGENVHKYMAIVLDNNVHTAPRIKQKISGGHAMIEMGSGQGRSLQDTLNEAKDTALVLRSGALPARLEFLEERVVGPSLGADAIKAGTISLGLGLLFVFVFMGFYYRASGMIANFALLLNGLFVLAALAAFEGTLSLPGLAGLTLTLGMAVDANVLIFEHIREEFRNGKGFALALSEGYHRALSAILDSHLTTILAGTVLLSFGYGPIRGFAVTMLIGLIASLYTSVFVTRVFHDYFTVRKGKAISI